MAITRTAKGTNASKSSGVALTVSSVSANAGSLLVVGIAWEEDNVGEKPTIKWGNRDLKYIPGSEATRGDTIVRLYRTRVKKNVTKDMTATWPTALTARAMFVTMLKESSVTDGVQTNSGASTINLATGASFDASVDDTISIAAFATLGPSDDLQGVAGLGHSLGQRVGTSGGGSASNVTIQETYEILTVLGGVRATLTLTTGRPYCCSIAAFKSSQIYTVNRAYYQPWDSHPSHESVVFVMEDESNTEVFQVLVDREEFESMTDTEVEDLIAEKCQWYDAKIRDNAPSPDFVPDAAFNTRVTSFENDVVVI